MAENGLGLAKKLIWNRRYKAWKTWFYSLVIIAIFCIFKDNTEILKIYAMWSTIGLVALVGGLSLTDLMKIKNGGS